MNLHYQFWVDYYKEFENTSELSKAYIEAKNDALVNSKWKLSQKEIPLLGGMQTLTFKVLYPGLLIGLGYEHGTDLVKDAPKIALGLSLDYTTGLPCIPGSEVKGLLRSAFISSKDLINLYLDKKSSDEQWSDEIIHALEVDIFGHTHPCDNLFNPQKGAEEGQGKDVFFDAFPIKADRNGHLIGLENITSHISQNHEYQGLTAINPITLLKVMPDVVFLFRFRLCDSVIKIKEGEILVTADDKLTIFENIIADFGMGAKTKVGFGLMEKCEMLKSGTEYTAQIVEVKKSQIKVKVEGFSTNPVIKIDEIDNKIREGKTDLKKVTKFTVNAKCRIALKETATDENGKVIRIFSLVSMTEDS